MNPAVLTSQPVPSAPAPEQTYPLLFSPYRLNRLALPNRIVLTAMVTRLSGSDGLVNQDIIDRYVRFARGEPGLIVVEATAVHESKSGPLLRLSSDEFILGHRLLLERMREAGPAKVALQIIHFLKIARSGWRQTVDMLSRDDLQSIVQAYGQAAARARAAGYDAVELHMAHAYTLSSMLSARNRRRDEYGGRSLEGRLRLPSEVLAQVRAQVGPDYPVGLRFDGEEALKGGYGLTDSRNIALRFAQLGADYLSLSAGGKFEGAVIKAGEPLYPYTGYLGDRTMPPATYSDGANGYLAESIKHFVNAHGYAIPVVTTGKINTPDLAEAILVCGQANLIGLARALLADPDWPKKARMGRGDSIVRCIYGNICKNLDENFKQVRCGSLWPRQHLHAPETPEDDAPPAWPEEDARLVVKLNENGQVRLTWQAAQDPQGVYGYEIFRAVNAGHFVHITSSLTPTHVDEFALAGNRYAYTVRAYDFAGNRSARCHPASLEVPASFPVPAGRTLALDGDVGNTSSSSTVQR